MFGGMVRAYRLRLSMTQEELASRAGLSVRGLRKLEAGQVTRPQPNTVRLLADAFALTGEERDRFCRSAFGDGTDLPAGHRTPVPPRQLPATTYAFTGRAEELAVLDRLKDDSTVVVAALDGMAGVGKTALAIEWGHRVAERFPDGQIYHDLKGFSEPAAPVAPADALERLLRTMGVPIGQIPEGLEDRAALWRSTLAGRRMLLVLDNAATPDHVRPLLPGSPGCLVLVTSRRRLAALDPTVSVSLDLLPLADAVTLFARAAEREQAATGEYEQVREIVEFCGRLPLAIRIAAARLRSHPSWRLADLADRLRPRGEQLAELDDGARRVNAALDLSYRQLPAAGQRTYRLLGVHPGADVDPYATAALAGLTIGQARRQLDHLFNVHLLQELLPGRLTMHDLVRAHAVAAAGAEPEDTRRAATRRLLDYYRHAAAEAMDVARPLWRGDDFEVPAASTPTPTMTDPARAVAWLDAELENMLAAAAQANAYGLAEHVKQLAVILPEHLHTRGRYGDLATLYRHSLTASQATGDRAGECAAHNGLGWADWLRSRYESSREHFMAALAVSRAIGHRAQESEALIGQGWSFLRQGQQERAHEAFQAALEIASAISDHGYERQALLGLGWLYWHQGRYEPALGAFSRAAEVSRKEGSRAGELDALLALGNTHRAVGRHEDALDSFAQALTYARDAGHRYGEMHALLGFGNVHRVLARYESALDHYREALEVARDTGQLESEMDALCGMGHVCRRLGRHQPAGEHYRRALDLAREFGNRQWQMEARYGLGRLCHAAGQPAAALVHYQQALALATDLRQPAVEAQIRDGLAQAHRLLGDTGTARRHWQRALEIFADLGVDRSPDEETTVERIRDHLSGLAG